MVFISRVGFGICRFYLAIPIAKMSANKKINLEIKSDALRILKKVKNVTSTARIINAKYNLSVSPSTICRWKQKAAKIERNADVSKSHKKIFRMFAKSHFCSPNLIWVREKLICVRQVKVGFAN